MPDDPILNFFDFERLPYQLRGFFKPLHTLANFYNDRLPDGPEKTAGLRKLLEARDCFMRALPSIPD